MEQTSRTLSTTEKDLYFLIAKFLAAGPCTETAEVLVRELGCHGIVPKRLDWEGDEHEQDFDELERKYNHIGPNHLLQVCERVEGLLAKDFPPAVANLNSLLGAGKQSLLRSEKDLRRLWYSIRQYAARLHQQPLLDPITFTSHHNLVKVLHAREVSGPPRRIHIAGPKLHKKFELYCRTLGHLSAVYCVLFDHTGRYIITGADDFLVKVWGAHDGRLLATLRGASAEISDIAINNENTLLAAGSLDRILRVWCLQYTHPIAVLSGHSATITSVNFCPYQHGDKRYLVTTSADGSIAFWDYMHQANGQGKQVKFSPRPLQYNERIRPGQAQMICASFSAGGMFLAAGSADHYVRVYVMDDDEGPHRILEVEAHTDRVDSVCWAHNELRFITGSKDGTANIWHYERQQWKSIKLHMTQKLPGEKESDEESKLKLKVTMVSWDLSDRYVVTAVNDYTIKIWTSDTGVLTRVLRGHKGEMFVLESHPLDNHVLLSVGHDGMLFVWDIVAGEILSSYQNVVEGQDSPSIFDAKWSPDGTMAAATDAHGHVMLFGLGSGSDKFQLLPPEMYFHTDYRPLVRDANNFVLDEQTQLAPHLMPPPFLVDMDGNPYPPNIQRLVPGRELCHLDQLVPNIGVTAQNRIEVVGPGHEPRSHIDHMIAALAQRQNSVGEGANATPPQAGSPRHGVRQSSGNWQRDNDVRWTKRVVVKPLAKSVYRAVRQKIAQLAQSELDQFKREQRRRPVMITVTAPSNRSKQMKTKARNPVNGRCRPRRVNGGHDSEFENPDNLDLDSNSGDSLAMALGGGSAGVEEDSASSSPASSSEYSDWIADHGAILEPPKRSRRKPVRRRACTRHDSDTDDSDEPELAPDSDEEKPHKPRKPKPKPKKKAPPLPAAAVQSFSEISEEYRPSEWLTQTIPRKSPYYPQMGDEVMFFQEGYQEYLKAVRQKEVYDPGDKAEPYKTLNIKEPQLVKVVYMKYEIRPPRLCCLKLNVLNPDGSMTKDFFSIKYHDMNDVLDFLVLLQTYQTALDRDWKEGDQFRSMINDDWWTGQIECKRTSPSPYQSLKGRWDNGENEWMSPWDLEPLDPTRLPTEIGGAMPVLPEEITEILYHPRDEEWPQGGREVATARILAGLEQVMQMSVAEYFLAPVDLQQYPSYALMIEYPVDLSLIKLRFQNRFYRRITSAQFDVRYLATNAEKFNEPHSSIVKSARIVTELCLKVIAVPDELDVAAEYHRIQEEYHSDDSDPVNAEIDVEEPGPSGINSSQKPQVIAARPSSSGLRTLGARVNANEAGPSGSGVRRRLSPPRAGPSGVRTNTGSARNKAGPSRRAHDNILITWTEKCEQLIQSLYHCDDSHPFREPVDLEEHPDYLHMVKVPMDLSTVRENLEQKKYGSPEDFCKDMRLIFSNSKSYNTNKRSRIYTMTWRLSSTFENQMRDIMQSWKAAKRREGHRARLSEDFVSTANGLGKRRSQLDSDVSDEDDNENDDLAEENDGGDDEDYGDDYEANSSTKRNGFMNGLGVRPLPARGARSTPESDASDDDDDGDDDDEDEDDSERRFGRSSRSSRPMRAAALVARKRKRSGDADSEDSYRPGSRRKAQPASRRSAASRNPPDSDASDVVQNRRKKKRLNYVELSDDSSTVVRARTSLRRKAVTASASSADKGPKSAPVRIVTVKAGPSRTEQVPESDSESSSSSSSSSRVNQKDESEASEESDSEGNVDLNVPPPRADRTMRSNRQGSEEEDDEDVEEEEEEEEEDTPKRASRTVRREYAESSSEGESEDAQWSAKPVRGQVNGGGARRTTQRTLKPRNLDNGTSRSQARRRRAPAPNYAEESEDEVRPSLVTVSSRGRVRKVTEKCCEDDDDDLEKQKAINTTSTRFSSTFGAQTRDVRSLKAAKRRKGHMARFNEDRLSTGKVLRKRLHRLCRDSSDDTNSESDNLMDENDNARKSLKRNDSTYNRGDHTWCWPTRGDRYISESDEENESHNDDDSDSKRSSCGRLSRSSRPRGRLMALMTRKRNRLGNTNSEDSYRPRLKRKMHPMSRRSLASQHSSGSNVRHIRSRRKKKRLNYGELSDDSNDSGVESRQKKKRPESYVLSDDSNVSDVRKKRKRQRLNCSELSDDSNVSNVHYRREKKRRNCIESSDDSLSLLTRAKMPLRKTAAAEQAIFAGKELKVVLVKLEMKKAGPDGRVQETESCSEGSSRSSKANDKDNDCEGSDSEGNVDRNAFPWRDEVQGGSRERREKKTLELRNETIGTKYVVSSSEDESEDKQLSVKPMTKVSNAEWLKILESLKTWKKN